MATKVTKEQLLRAKKEGLTIMQAASEFEVSHSNIINAERAHDIILRRAGHEDWRYRSNYREIVQDMKPLDAVNYLLEVIDGLKQPVEFIWHFKDVRLTRAERQLVYTLATSKHAAVSRKALIDALMFGREGDDAPNEKILDVFVCRIRHKLRNTDIKIITHWEQGYSIQVPKNYIWPWQNPNPSAGEN